MIGAGMFLTGGSIILFAFLDDVVDTFTYVGLAFAIRITQGLGASLYISATFSVTAALYPRQIGFVYGLLETANTIGRIIGPTVGGSLYSLGGFKLPFLVVGSMLLGFGAISMLLLVVAGFFLPVLDKLETPKDTPNNNTGKNKKAKDKEKSFVNYFKTSIHGWICSISIVTVSFAMSFPETTLSIYLAQLGMTDPSQVGLVFLLGSLAYAIVCIALGKLSDIFPKTIFMVCLFIFTLFISPLLFWKWSMADDGIWIAVYWSGVCLWRPTRVTSKFNPSLSDYDGHLQQHCLHGNRFRHVSSAKSPVDQSTKLWISKFNRNWQLHRHNLQRNVVPWWMFWANHFRSFDRFHWLSNDFSPFCFVGIYFNYCFGDLWNHGTKQLLWQTKEQIPWICSQAWNFKNPITFLQPTYLKKY